MSKVTKTFQYGDREFTLETGEIARQADACVITKCGDTQVMVSVVSKITGEPKDFMPLTIDVEERTYAAGRIPGGFFRREGRPGEKSILLCRLIDRPLRPMFPKGFGYDVQVVITIVSIDPDVDVEIVSLIGAAAAMSASGIPFNGPVAAARVGYIEGEYKLNPLLSELENSELDLVVAGTRDAVLMVESEANILPEDVMLGAVTFGQEASVAAIDAITEFAKEVGKPMQDWTPPVETPELDAKVAELVEADLIEAFQTPEKMERQDKVSAAHVKLLDALVSEDVSKDQVNVAFKD
jgi:polyribonucleotide nucleotidyltransferase